MSKLDELIAELCPDGVPFKRIKDVYTRLKGTPITAGKMKDISSDEGEIRIFAGGKTVIDAHEVDIPKANITRVPAVLVQSRGVIDFVYYDKPFTFKNEMWAYTAENKVSVKFLYYVLKNNISFFRDAASGMGSLPQISLKITEDYRLPVPPLKVQREIVHILDSFTLLTAELTAELTARRKQYEFYRDKLLTIKDDIPIKKIGEICKVVSGGTPSRKNAEYWENGSIKWLGSTVCQNKKTIDKVTDYITNEGLVNSSAKIMREGTTLVALVGATIGKVAFLPYDAAINQNIAGIFPKDRNILNPSYLYYACTMLYPKFLKLTKGSKLAMANLSFIRELEIPVPHIEVQNRIVYVLEHFEDICSDLNIGLPAEIEARKKQYEYYRDVLLTFAETGKTILTDRQTDRQTEYN